MKQNKKTMPDVKKRINFIGGKNIFFFFCNFCNNIVVIWRLFSQHHIQHLYKKVLNIREWTCHVHIYEILVN